jgi:hypothetical protein
MFLGLNAKRKSFLEMAVFYAATRKSTLDDFCKGNKLTIGLGGCGRRGRSVIYTFGVVDEELLTDVPQEGWLTEEAKKTYNYSVSW